MCVYRERERGSLCVGICMCLCPGVVSCPTTHTHAGQYLGGTSLDSRTERCDDCCSVGNLLGFTAGSRALPCPSDPGSVPRPSPLAVAALRDCDRFLCSQLLERLAAKVEKSIPLLLLGSCPLSWICILRYGKKTNSGLGGSSDRHWLDLSCC